MMLFAPIAVIGTGLYLADRSTNRADAMRSAQRESQRLQRDAARQAGPPPTHIRDYTYTSVFARGDLPSTHSQKCYAGDMQHFLVHPVTGQMITQPIRARGMQGEGIA